MERKDIYEASLVAAKKLGIPVFAGQPLDEIVMHILIKMAEMDHSSVRAWRNEAEEE